MHHKLHGVLSLVLIKLSVIIALVTVFMASVTCGLVYLAIVIMSSVTVMYAYCAKCNCRLDACSHVLPGRFTRWLPGRKQEAYTLADYAATAVSLIAIFAFPQYWLWQHKLVFGIFWLLTAIALIQIVRFVCRACRNENCLICPNKT